MQAGRPRTTNIRRTLALTLIALAILVIVLSLGYALLFGPVHSGASTAEFNVTPGESLDQVTSDLAAKGYVRFPWIARITFLAQHAGVVVRPGEYELSASMDAWTVSEALIAQPYAAWVTIPVGLRKEQVADILANSLGWTPAQKTEWLTVDTDTSPNYVEGVYFPDTYLIPSDTPPAQVAAILQERFKVAFAPYAAEAVQKGIPWPTVITIASLIQREAGSASDMPLISGIIQNRLKDGMPLAIDATLQYMTGTEGNWWPVPQSASTYADTPFNTYKNVGLPPHAIASPGLTAIAAALNPDRTSCLFYIHDNNGQIHCSPTYAGQQKNVARYLK